MAKERFIAEWLAEDNGDFDDIVYGHKAFDTQAAARQHAVSATICEWARVSREVLRHYGGPAPYWADVNDAETFIGDGVQDAQHNDAWEQNRIYSDDE